SCFTASYSNGPLLSGQTRISKSFGSMRLAGGSELMRGSSVGWCRRSIARRPGSLQVRFAGRAALGEVDLVDRHENLGSGLEVWGLEQSLLLGRAIGGHHRQRIDQRLVGRVLDPLPVGLQVVGAQEL